jgi:hypothetical protein
VRLAARFDFRFEGRVLMDVPQGVERINRMILARISESIQQEALFG